MVDETALDLERRVGHPNDRWNALLARVQDTDVRDFADVESDWLDLMWSLDAYRIARVKPEGFSDLGALNRSKGNWFAALIALLLENRTHHRIGARTRVPGFSQYHQIDIAWPARGSDPLICCETKVMGAPAHGATPARNALSDFVNRRKELKFAATDLKLYRRQQRTRIEHWDVWRQRQPPRTYFLWAARLEPDRDRIEVLVREARALLDTYLDGVGLVAWSRAPDREGYVAVKLPVGQRVTELDDVLYQIQSFINTTVDDEGNPPPAEDPAVRVINQDELPIDPGATGPA